MSRKPNKILFILHLPPPVHGAAIVGKYIQQSEFINSSFECSFINLSTSKHLRDIGENGFKKMLYILKLYYKVLSALFKKRFDLCYLTINSKGTGFYKEMVIVFLLKIFRCNIVYHYHNKGVSQRQSNFFINYLYHFQFKNASVILLSKLLYPDIAKYLPPEKVYYCPNGIPDFEKINIDFLHYNRLICGTPKILFLSNMMKSKGVFTLLEASKILYDKGIKFKTLFVGEWFDIKELEFYTYVIENHLEENVIYLGKKNDGDKEAVLKEVKIFVHPTQDDCFPLVILEAMQYGLPIISTYEGAIPELIQDGVSGILIPKNNPKLLADKIEFLINQDSTCYTMGQKGITRFKELYTINKFENNFVSTLIEIITTNSCSLKN
jgi:glycosyltransferase involved in cell wall biosynthesis